MQSARSPFARVARTALFAASAVALSECSSMPSPQPLYGAVCTNDACAEPVDAGAEAGDAAKEAASDAAID